MNTHGLIVHDCFQITKNLSFKVQSYGFYSMRVQIKYIKKKKECESCKKNIDKLNIKINKMWRVRNYSFPWSPR